MIKIKITDMLQDILKTKWEESYQRGENFIFYPKEEIVKFLNRFVRKRTGVDTFTDILDFKNTIRGLDYGCGIGRLTILMREFGIDAYGIDIASPALAVAKDLAVKLGSPELQDRFSHFDGGSIPFEDNFFDITISEGVLDSMSFELAKRNLKEIGRVTKQLAFVSLISGDTSEYHREFCEEKVVQTEHEIGTVQSYFNWSKIQELIAGTNFIIDWCNLVTEESVISHYKYGRYYVVLKKV